MRAAWLVVLAGYIGAADRTPLIDAVRRGDHEAVRAAISSRADVNAAEPDGSSALLWASYRNDAEVVDLLLKNGANATAANDLGVTPLWAACQNGSNSIVNRLLEAAANPNAALESGETPLMVASRGGYADVVEQLLVKGANPNARATRSQTALMWAAAQKHPAVVKVLAVRGADLHARSDSWTNMEAVPPHGYPGYNKLIPHGNYTALLFAARAGDLESAKVLVEFGANVNDADAWGVSALVLAGHSGFTDLALFLLEKGADPNAAPAGFTALHEAIMRRDERLIRALLARKADPNAPLRTWTPTRRSSKDFNFEPVLVGATPYWLAARFLQPTVMRLLAAQGADPRFIHHSDIVAEKGYKHRKDSTSALMAALGMGGGAPWVQAPSRDRAALTLESVKAALELGADLNVFDSQGRTAVAFAKSQGMTEIAQYLESAGGR